MSTKIFAVSKKLTKILLFLILFIVINVVILVTVFNIVVPLKKYDYNFFIVYHDYYAREKFNFDIINNEKIFEEYKKEVIFYDSVPNKQIICEYIYSGWTKKECMYVIVYSDRTVQIVKSGFSDVHVQLDSFAHYSSYHENERWISTDYPIEYDSSIDDPKEEFAKLSLLQYFTFIQLLKLLQVRDYGQNYLVVLDGENIMDKFYFNGKIFYNYYVKDPGQILNEACSTFIRNAISNDYTKKWWKVLICQTEDAPLLCQ